MIPQHTPRRVRSVDWQFMNEGVVLAQAAYTKRFRRRTYASFEPWSSDVDDTHEWAPPPLLTTTPHQWEDVSALDRFNVLRCPYTVGLGER
ncbi:hypothetical protein TNCV_4137921 [Trichonephila clavipes]|nr:hypothetical protein TNCV_4137921 [Trichonephila clavipes]